jgi:hypothetical protein
MVDYLSFSNYHLSSSYVRSYSCECNNTSCINIADMVGSSIFFKDIELNLHESMSAKLFKLKNQNIYIKRFVHSQSQPSLQPDQTANTLATGA